MKLKISRNIVNNLLAMTSYLRYNFFVDGHYLAAAFYERKPSLEEVYYKAYHYILDNPRDVSDALNNDKITIKDCGWLNKEDVLEIELMDIELDRKKRIIRKKLEDIEHDFIQETRNEEG